MVASARILCDSKLILNKKLQDHSAMNVCLNLTCRGGNGDPGSICGTLKSPSGDAVEQRMKWAAAPYIEFTHCLSINHEPNDSI